MAFGTFKVDTDAIGRHRLDLAAQELQLWKDLGYRVNIPTMHSWLWAFTQNFCGAGGSESVRACICCWPWSMKRALFDLE